MKRPGNFLERCTNPDGDPKTGGSVELNQAVGHNHGAGGGGKRAGGEDSLIN